MNEVNTYLANAVRSQRAIRHWTQADLAERLGWAQSSVSATEVGRKILRMDEVFELADAFDIPVFLMFRDAPRELRLKLLGPRLADRLEL